MSVAIPYLDEFEQDVEAVLRFDGIAQRVRRLH